MGVITPGCGNEPPHTSHGPIPAAMIADPLISTKEARMSAQDFTLVETNDIPLDRPHTIDSGSRVS